MYMYNYRHLKELQFLHNITYRIDFILIIVYVIFTIINVINLLLINYIMQLYNITITLILYPSSF
jgi:hypothetical protein